MLSDIRPGGPLQSSEKTKVFLIKDAQHADDSFTTRGLANLGIRISPHVLEVQSNSLDIMKKWVGEYQAPKGSR